MNAMEKLARLPVGRGEFIVIDAADAELVAGRRWYARWSEGRRS